MPAVADLPRSDASTSQARTTSVDYAVHADADLVRPWAIPGTPGLEHRIGGIEKPTGPGPSPTSRRTTSRWSASGRPRSRASSQSAPLTWTTRPEGRDPDRGVGYHVRGDQRRARAPRAGRAGRAGHVRYMNPMPAAVDIVRRVDHVLVPEMNLGQLGLLLRGLFLVDAKGQQGEGPAVQDRLVRGIDRAVLAGPLAGPGRGGRRILRAPGMRLGAGCQMICRFRLTWCRRTDSFAGGLGLRVRSGGPLVPGLR